MRQVGADLDVLDLRGGLEVDDRDGAGRLVRDQPGLPVRGDRRPVGIVAGVDVADGLRLQVDDRGRVAQVQRRRTLAVGVHVLLDLNQRLDHRRRVNEPGVIVL